MRGAHRARAAQAAGRRRLHRGQHPAEGARHPPRAARGGGALHRGRARPGGGAAEARRPGRGARAARAREGGRGGKPARAARTGARHPGVDRRDRRSGARHRALPRGRAARLRGRRRRGRAPLASEGSDLRSTPGGVSWLTTRAPVIVLTSRGSRGLLAPHPSVGCVTERAIATFPPPPNGGVRAGSSVGGRSNQSAPSAAECIGWLVDRRLE